MKPWRKVATFRLYPRHKGRWQAMEIVLECGHKTHENAPDNKPYPVRRRCSDCKELSNG